MMNDPLWADRLAGRASNERLDAPEAERAETVGLRDCLLQLSEDGNAPLPGGCDRLMARLEREGLLEHNVSRQEKANDAWLDMLAGRERTDADEQTKQEATALRECLLEMACSVVPVANDSAAQLFARLEKEGLIDLVPRVKATVTLLPTRRRIPIWAPFALAASVILLALPTIENVIRQPSIPTADPGNTSPVPKIETPPGKLAGNTDEVATSLQPNASGSATSIASLPPEALPIELTDPKGPLPLLKKEKSGRLTSLPAQVPRLTSGQPTTASRPPLSVEIAGSPDEPGVPVESRSSGGSSHDNAPNTSQQQIAKTDDPDSGTTVPKPEGAALIIRGRKQPEPYAPMVASPPSPPISSVLFAIGSDELGSGNLELLREHAQYIQRWDAKIVLECHDPDDGAVKRERELAFQRSVTVRDKLLELGVPAASVKISSCRSSVTTAKGTITVLPEDRQLIEIIYSH